ncbi:MAG: sterol desaturase family protein, partial [Bacteroidota bacterium]
MENLLSSLSESVPAAMTVAALIMVIVEWLALFITEKMEGHKEGWVNIACGAVSFLPVFLLNFLLTTTLMFGLYSVRLFDLGFEWWVWLLAYIGYDFMSFFTHWASHKVRILWAIHSVHHAPTEMKASVSFRGSFADFLVTPHISLWLPLLGFHPFMIIIVEGVAMLYGVPLHFSEKYMPKSEPSWLRKIFMTPSIHRLHHAKNPHYLDTNYSLTFSIWDHIFQTYQNHVDAEEPEYGVLREHDSANFASSQTHEFKALWA